VLSKTLRNRAARSPKHLQQDAESSTNIARKWVRNPNGWIAAFTCVVVITGIVALLIARDTEKNQLSAFVTVSDLNSGILPAENGQAAYHHLRSGN
jgi:hypothetical protein